jgi:arsenite methyltransferase
LTFIYPRGTLFIDRHRLSWTGGADMGDQAQDVREQVRERYAAAAARASTRTAASCCGGGCSTEAPDPAGGLYDEVERSSLPEEAVLASLGCGNPLAVAELREGETVLDLGSGGGIDVLLSARRVGPAGKVYGLDMTEEMLALAQANADKAGATNVDFLKGHIEAIPLPADRVDVIISNCVINLSVDKPAVFAEMFRVLKPGGRLGISDVVAEDQLTAAERAERGEYTACIAGALSFAEYRKGLAEAGFTGIEITPTHEAAENMHSAVVRAAKPREAVARRELPLVTGAAEGGCCG